MGKRFVLGLVLLAFCLSLAACGQTDPEPQQTGAFETDGEIISDAIDPDASRSAERFGLAYQAASGLNPFTCDNLTNRTALSLLYEGLFVVGPEFEAEPVLCDTFTRSDDGLTYTVRLVQGVTFSDGTPLTAEDVSVSYLAAQNSELFGSRMRYFYGVSAADDQTVIFSMTAPYENLPLLLDIPIVKASSVYDARPVGTGPYQVASDGGAQVLRRRDDWWQEHDSAVTAEQITLVETETPTDVRDDFEYGITGVVCTDPNAAGYVDYRCDFELWNCPTAIMDYIGFNTTAGTFSTPLLRAAFTHLVDRETIATDLYKGYGAAASLPASPLSPFYDTALAETYDFAPQRFRDVMEELELSEVSGTFLVCNSDPKRVQAAQIIADTAGQYGLKLTVKALPDDEYSYALLTGEYDLYFGEVRLSPNFDLSGFFVGGSLCIGGIGSQDMVVACQGALENAGNYYTLHQSVMDQGLLCPVLFKSYAVYATRGIVSDLVPAVDAVFHTASGRSLADAAPVPETPSDETTTAG